MTLKRGSRSGFSALEMAICFLIIAVCTAFVIRANGRATSCARRVSCGSNLHQLALASQMYAADYAGRGPVGFVPPILMPYVKNQQIFLCPSNRDAPWVNGETGAPARAPAPEKPGKTMTWAEIEREKPPATMQVGYAFRTGWWNDDPPETLLAQDLGPKVHRGQWQGARLDGAVRVFPPDQWKPLK